MIKYSHIKAILEDTVDLQFFLLFILHD